jgi:molecular chaperone DnaK (HSP70)
LGTTNSVLASLDSTLPEDEVRIDVHPIPQLTNPGEVADADSLPSFLYLPSELDFPAGSLSLPWDNAPEYVVGELARTRGAENPSRLVASAKSWLSHAGVNRTEPILPWGSPGEVPKLSPVAA